MKTFTLILLIACGTLLPQPGKAQSPAEIIAAYKFFDDVGNLGVVSCAFHMGPNQCRSPDRCASNLNVLKMLDSNSPATRALGAQRLRKHYGSSAMNANCLASLMGGNASAALRNASTLAKAGKDGVIKVIEGPQRPDPIPPSKASYFSFYYKNKCDRRIQTAIRYKNLNGEWVTGGWWGLDPGETAFVAKTKNRVYYMYGESIAPVSSRMYWRGKDKQYRIRNSSNTYGFIRKEVQMDRFGKWTQNYTCR